MGYKKKKKKINDTMGIDNMNIHHIYIYLIDYIFMNNLH